MQLAFPLLDRPVVLDGKRLGSHLRARWPGVRFVSSAGEGGALVFAVDGNARLYVQQMAAPVPEGEAEDAVRYSVSSSFGRAWAPAPHAAHLVVTMQEDEARPSLDRLVRFTMLLAGLLDGIHGVVGVYWGHAGATHDPLFFRRVARAPDGLPIRLWNGVSVVAGAHRVGFVSRGMAQLGLPNLWLTAPRDEGNEALEFFFDTLEYVADRREPIGEGHTIGRTLEERLVVRYEPSPLHPAERVCSVHIPRSRPRRMAIPPAPRGGFEARMRP